MQFNSGDSEPFARTEQEVLLIRVVDKVTMTKLTLTMQESSGLDSAAILGDWAVTSGKVGRIL